MREEPSYGKLSAQDLQEENRRVLAALKVLEGRLDKELELQKHSRIAQPAHEQQADQLKVVLESIKNNEQCIRVLEKDLRHHKERREELANGLESKLNARKHELEKKIADGRAELKRMRLEENELNKKLATRDNPSEP
jgi:chromosome segregation ATPase